MMQIWNTTEEILDLSCLSSIVTLMKFKFPKSTGNLRQQFHSEIFFFSMYTVKKNIKSHAATFIIIPELFQLQKYSAGLNTHVYNVFPLQNQRVNN